MKEIEDRIAEGLVVSGGILGGQAAELPDALALWYGEDYRVATDVDLRAALNPDSVEQLPENLSANAIDAVVFESRPPHTVVSIYLFETNAMSRPTEPLLDLAEDHGILVFPVQQRSHYSMSYVSINFLEQNPTYFATYLSHMSCPYCDAQLLLTDKPSWPRRHALKLTCSGEAPNGRGPTKYCERCVISLDKFAEELVDAITEAYFCKNEPIYRNLEEASKPPLCFRRKMKDRSIHYRC